MTTVKGPRVMAPWGLYGGPRSFSSLEAMASTKNTIGKRE